MHGLSEDLDLSFFAGETLIQIGMGAFQISFVFQGDDPYDLAQRVSLRVHDAALPPGRIYSRHRSSRLPGGGRRLTALDQPRCRMCNPHPGGALRLEFSNGAPLEVDDDSTHYESYTINHGDRLIVV
jgi:hypothetical protein